MLCRMLSDDDREALLEYSDGSAVAKSEENDDIDIGDKPWRYKYEKMSLTWKFINRTEDFERKDYLRRVFVICFRAIGLRCKLKIRYERDESKDTDITIQFTSDLAVFDNRKSVLAQAYLYVPNSRFNGIQQYNDNHFFTAFGGNVPAWKIDPLHYRPGDPTMIKSEPLLHIALHETMHTLGYKHDLIEKDAILWPYIKSPTHPHAFIYHERDIFRLQKHYGYRGISGRILAYFLNRRLKKLDFR